MEPGFDAQQRNNEMSKLAEVHVDCCRECPFSEFDNQEEPHKWGKTWCTHLDKQVNFIEIDEDCPLEDL